MLGGDACYSFAIRSLAHAPMTLDQGHEGYKLFKYGQDRCLRVVFRPN